MKKIIKKMLAFIIPVISIYLIINLMLYFFQEKLIFFPRELSNNSIEVIKNKGYEINMSVNDVNLHGWLLNKGEDKLIIYYGGNAEEVSANINDMLNVEGYSVLLMNYRGYGLSEGSPGEKELFDDALAVFDKITGELNIFPEDVVLFGRSLGSGVAVYVASKRKISKLVLITPFDSVKDVARKQFPVFPVGLLLKHPFNSVQHAKSITYPSLVIIGDNDNIISNENSMRLVNSWNGECKPVIIENAGHNNIHIFPEYWESINEFLR